MALLAELTTDQLNAIRSYNHYHALQFVCLVPNNVVVQFQPDSTPTTDVYAEITVGTVIEGDMADIKEGQLVIYSTTANYQATETFRNRVRQVSGTTILRVGENSQTLTDTMYVTVIDTYEVMERLRKDATHVDWNITFRKLRPIETALKSAYVLTNDNVTWSETANAIPMDASATTINTHSWSSSNPNDTLDSGGTTNNPTFTLEVESFRWLRYEFSDDIGLLNYRVIPVWTVSKDYQGAIALGFIGESGDVADISFDAELGWSATVPAWTGINELLNKTYCVIACDEWYDDERQSIRTNINFVGYLQNEDTSTQGDEQLGKKSETRFAVEGFGHQLARQNVSQITVIQTAGTPIAWDQIQNPTPGRFLTYRLTEYSTILNLCSLTIPDDDADFIGDDLSIASGKALDDARFIGEVINAELQFDVDGKMDLCRDLNFLNDTARDAAPVFATLTPSDLLSFNYDNDYSKTTSQITLTGGDYETSLDRYDKTEATAPAVARLSEGDPQQLSNQVLLTDSTQAEANEELAQRAANKFAHENPTYLARGTLKDEWHFAVPDVGSWVQFDIAGTDTVRGKEFGAADRWQFIQISVGTNSQTGRRQVDFVARHETRSTGAMVRANPIQNDAAADILYYPAVLSPYLGAGLDYTDDNWYDSQDVAPPSEPNPPPADCELLGLRPKSGNSVNTDGSALNGETVASTVRGKGRIKQGTLFDFTASDEGFVGFPQTGSGTPQGTHSAGVGWIASNTNNGGSTHWRGTFPYKNGLALGTVITVTVTYDYEKAAVLGVPGSTLAGIIYVDDTVVATRTFNDFPASGTDLTWQWTGSVVDTNSIGARIDCDSDLVSAGNLAGNVTIKSIAVNGDTIYSDAFYYWSGSIDEPVDVTPHDTGDGLQIEAGDVDGIPPFSPTSEYTVFTIVTSGPVNYDFVSPYPLSAMDNWSLQVLHCFLGIL